MGCSFHETVPLSGFLVVYDLEESIKLVILVRVGWGWKWRDDGLGSSFLGVY